MHWSITHARQQLPRMLRQAAQQPQRLYNRKCFVAAVVDAKTYERFQHWSDHHSAPPPGESVGDAFAGLRRICTEESYTLDVPSRADRLNPFSVDVSAGAADESAL